MSGGSRRLSTCNADIADATGCCKPYTTISSSPGYAANTGQNVHENHPSQRLFRSNRPKSTPANYQLHRRHDCGRQKREKSAGSGGEASHKTRTRNGNYRSVTSSFSTQSRNRDSVILGFWRVSMTPMRSCVRKSMSNHGCRPDSQRRSGTTG